jgi:predicted ArsR family transcriptional regulator
MTEPASPIHLLARREIEARIAAPLIQALEAEFGEARVREVVQGVIAGLARQHGAALAEQMGGCTLAHFIQALTAWQQGDAMQMEVLEESETRYAFNATRCRYAEMYQALGIPELGRLLSCSRDFALVEGFNPQIKLRRTQTLLDGAPYCDFCFEIEK